MENTRARPEWRGALNWVALASRPISGLSADNTPSPRVTTLPPAATLLSAVVDIIVT